MELGIGGGESLASTRWTGSSTTMGEGSTTCVVSSPGNGGKKLGMYGGGVLVCSTGDDPGDAWSGATGDGDRGGDNISGTLSSSSTVLLKGAYTRGIELRLSGRVPSCS